MSRRAVANLVALLIARLACVLLAAAGQPWLGTSILLTVTLASVRSTNHAKLLAIAAAAGFAGEWALHSAGITGYPPQAWTNAPIPLWTVALWLNVASIVRAAFPLLQDRFVLITMLGALAGPASYWTEERLGAITLNPDPAVWITGTGALCLVAAPLFTRLAEPLGS